MIGKLKVCFLMLVFAIGGVMVYSQEPDSATERPCFISTSLFMVMNIFENPSPNFYQLNLGYRITPKDVLIVEAITWTYHEPLGIQYWDEGKEYPGAIREFGLGLAYQRFIWKGFYSAFHATPFFRQYLDKDNEIIQNGFQLFLTLRFGYHISLFKNRLFFEPSIAFTAWPISTNVPSSFRETEKGYNKFFLFEPGLHFGVKF
jgi:hypothetical protein